MRFVSLARSLAALVLLFVGTLAANAESYLFHFTPNNDQGLGFSFTLDPAASLYIPGNAYAFGGVNITLSNGYQYTSIVYLWQSGAPVALGQGYDLSIQNPTTSLVNIDYTGTQLYSVIGSNMAFDLGSFSLEGITTPDGVLAISAVAPTPEPSSLLLLSTGSLGLLGAARRKIIDRR